MRPPSQLCHISYRGGALRVAHPATASATHSTTHSTTHCTTHCTTISAASLAALRFVLAAAAFGWSALA